jgi:prepilin-type N-terminal cleavage/methylation domain-containing protein
MKKKNNKGFSLIEVIVSMTLFTIVFVSLLQLLDVTSSLQRNAKKREHVTYLTTSIYETYLVNPKPDVFKDNLEFLFTHVEEQNEDYIIFLNGEWEAVESSSTYAYKIYIDMSLSSNPVDTGLLLYSDSCQLKFYDNKDNIMYTKAVITAYVYR